MGLLSDDSGLHLVTDLLACGCNGVRSPVEMGVAAAVGEDDEGGQPAAMAASLEEDGAPYYGAPAVY
ncbi:hypothetical protein ACLOJK_022951 [Asimina triloba]